MRLSFDPESAGPGIRIAGLMLAAILSGLPGVTVVWAQSGAQPIPSTQQIQPTQSAPPHSPPTKASPPATKSAAPTKKAAGTPTRYLPNRFAGKAGVYYKTVWGVDSLAVKLTESGQIIRFTWRVLDPESAKPLSNKEAQPSLVDPQAGVSLVVPSMENIGMLRQSSTPEEGRTYWMAFSNKGRLVKKGHRVNVVIGQFRADGLAVDE
jgi:hypothetical protein